MERNFLTSSGTTGQVQTGNVRTGDIFSVTNRDALAIPFNVSSTGTSVSGQVVFDAPPLVARVLKDQYQLSANDITPDELAYLAILGALGSDPAFFETQGGYSIEVGPGNLADYLERPRLTDQELRRYIARKVYDEYSRSDLDALVQFDRLDTYVTGAWPRDFLRNAQVLESEQYLRMHRVLGEAVFHVQATARLVRDVERYGSAKDDAQATDAFAAVVRRSPVLASRADSILLEYDRFGAARTQSELASVFRATAPVVEDVLRNVLMDKGVGRDLPTLGPMIGELQRRNIAGIGLISQLNHVLKFGRDLEQHGTSMADSALRIAAANAFELLPQIAGL